MTVKDFVLNHSQDKYGLHLNCQIMAICQRKKLEMLTSLLCLVTMRVKSFLLDRLTFILSKAVGN